MPDDNAAQPSSLNKKPGDIIRAADWNALVEQMEQMGQQMAKMSQMIDQLSGDLNSHNHAPGSKGSLITTNSIQAGSIIGELMAPSSDIKARSLVVDGAQIIGSKLKHFTEFRGNVDFDYCENLAGKLRIETSTAPESFFAEMVIDVSTPTANPGNGISTTLGLLFRRPYSSGDPTAVGLTYVTSGLPRTNEIMWSPEPQKANPIVSYNDDRLQMDIEFGIFLGLGKQAQKRTGNIFAYARILPFLGNGCTLESLKLIISDPTKTQQLSSISSKFELAM